jgi:hypothetical protein
MAKGWLPVCLGLLVWIALFAPAAAQGPPRKLQHGVTPAASTPWGQMRKLQQDEVSAIPEAHTQLQQLLGHSVG